MSDGPGKDEPLDLTALEALVDPRPRAGSPAPDYDRPPLVLGNPKGSYYARERRLRRRRILLIAAPIVIAAATVAYLLLVR